MFSFSVGKHFKGSMMWLQRAPTGCLRASFGSHDSLEKLAVGEPSKDSNVWSLEGVHKLPHNKF